MTCVAAIVLAAWLRLTLLQPDLQALQGSSGAADDAAAALTAGLPSSHTSSSQQQQQQQRRQQQELLQSMQQLHRSQQQVVQQPEPVAVQRSEQQQQQQKQQQLLLSQWLQRPKRVVSPKESTWVFCEVLLLLQNMAADGSSSSQEAAASQDRLVRPSRLLLHSNGRVTVAAAAAAADPQEEAAYQSPEEAAAATVDAGQRHSYSLGVLFFDLLYAAPGGAAGRMKALMDLRQRVMPPAFLQQQPQEAALLLALLHPDPAERPSLQLLGGELLSGYCEALQERHKQQQGRDPDSLVFFLQTMQGRKQAEVQQVQQSVAQLDAQIAAVKAALCGMLQQQGQQGQEQQQEQCSRLGRCGSRAQLLCAADVACSSGEAAAAAAAGAAAAMDVDQPAAVAAAEDDMDEDDLEMERRERGRSKRRRIAPAGVAGTAANSLLSQPQQQLAVQQQQQQLPLLERSGSANSGNTAAAAAAGALTPPPAVTSKWDRVADRFPVLEDVYMKHRHAWEQQQEHEEQQQQQGDDRQQQQQQQGSGTSQALAVAGRSTAGQAAAAAVAGSAAARSSVSGGALTGRLQDFGYLQSFGEDLWAYSRFSGMAVRGTVRAAADVLGGGSAMVCAAAFDRDDEFVATAGVSKRIRIFEYASITSSACGSGCGCATGKAAAPGLGGFSRGGFGGGGSSPVSPSASAGAVGSSNAAAGGVDGIVYPVLELSSRSRLSCVVWSSYVKAHIASSDYEGVVQLWDANTGSDLVQFEEHAKRAWAVDFSRVEPTRLVSCSDDCTVKLWSIHQESSLATLQLHANVCSVQFSPESPHLLAAGCANYRTYLYDLRQTAHPLACVHGHKKAVSYVRWLSGDQLVTASTDNTLKLWSVPAMAAAGVAPANAAAAGSREAAAAAASACLATYSGHTNQRNFIGLAVLPGSPGDGAALGGSSSSSRGQRAAGYIACGSETNEVFAYHTSMPVPITSHNFGAAAGAVGAGSQRQQQGLGYRGSGSSRLGGGQLDVLQSDLAEAGGPGVAPEHFVSCVTWNRRQGTIVAANSAGHIKVVELVE